MNWMKKINWKTFLKSEITNGVGLSIMVLTAITTKIKALALITAIAAVTWLVLTILRICDETDRDDTP